MFEKLHDRGCLAVSSSDEFMVEFRVPEKEGSVVYQEAGKTLGLAAYYPAT